MTMNHTMTQVLMDDFGSAEVLKTVENKIPSPQPGELLIKVLAAGVNYSDVLRRRNTYFMPTPLLGEITSVFEV